jgi:flagellar biosynthesis/type III secretory pathway M-ring protein FliF/YscJ
MKNKLFKIKKFLTTLTNKQKIVAVGIVCITSILIGSLVIFISAIKSASS